MHEVKTTWTGDQCKLLSPAKFPTVARFSRVAQHVWRTSAILVLKNLCRIYNA